MAGGRHDSSGASPVQPGWDSTTTSQRAKPHSYLPAQADCSTSKPYGLKLTPQLISMKAKMEG